MYIIAAQVGWLDRLMWRMMDSYTYSSSGLSDTGQCQGGAPWPPNRLMIAIAASQASLWQAIVNRRVLLVDVFLILILGTLHVIAYMGPISASPNKEKLAESIRGAATGGLTIVGILIPLSVLAIQLRGGTSAVAERLPESVLVDFFVGDMWLVVSLGCGLYVVFVAAMRGLFEDIGQRKDVGILFGFQLIMLFVGVFRLVWGLEGLVSALLPSS
jgi:hypothetical protein